MKTKLQILMVFLLFSIGSMSQTPIISSDFETWSNGMPIPWGGSYTNISSNDITPFNLLPFQGNTAARILKTSPNNNDILSTQAFNLQAGKKYLVYIAVMGTANKITLRLKNNTVDTLILNQETLNWAYQTQWKVLSKEIYIPNDLNNVEFCLIIQGFTGYDIKLDDFKIIEIQNQTGNMNVNNINTIIHSNGIFAHNPHNFTPNFEVPVNSNLHTVYYSHIIAAGMHNNNLHLSNGNPKSNNNGDLIIEFYPGPIANNYLSLNYMSKYNRVWEVSKQQINNHIASWNSSSYVMPEVIQNWPGNGNVNNGEALLLAPFADLNSNNIYEPQLGEYPLIRGDKAIYFIFNDHNPTNSNSSPLKIESHGMLYAYNHPTSAVINNTVFIAYAIINRSQNSYNNFYLSSYTDIDIGYAMDDHIGCDTTLNFYYGYNAVEIDGINNMGYGATPPAQAVILLNKPMTTHNALVNYYVPTLGANASTYNAMKGLNPDGTVIIDNFSLNTTKYHYPGYPELNTGWTEPFDGNHPWDLKSLGSTGPTTFAPNQKFEFDLAYTYARATTGNNLTSLALLRQLVPDVHSFYNNQNYPPMLSTSIDENIIAQNSNKINIFPNPANESINVSLTGNSNLNIIEIFDIQGKLVISIKPENNSANINIENLTNGLYFVKVYTPEYIETKKFIKN